MNNSFFQTICDVCGLELSTLMDGCKYSVYGNKVCVVEGHKGICSYQPNCITFFAKKGKLKVVGSGISIKQLQQNFAILAGQISSVEMQID